MDTPDRPSESNASPKIGWCIVSFALGLIFLASVAARYGAGEYVFAEYSRTGVFRYPDWVWWLTYLNFATIVFCLPGAVTGIAGLIRVIPGLRYEATRVVSVVGLLAALFGVA